MKASTIALRDQLRAVIRDADAPLSTDEVAAHVGLVRAHSNTGMGWLVYPHLRALERQGVCDRVHVDFDMRVFWRAIASPAPELLSLEEFRAAFGGDS